MSYFRRLMIQQKRNRDKFRLNFLQFSMFMAMKRKEKQSKREINEIEKHTTSECSERSDDTRISMSTETTSNLVNLPSPKAEVVTCSVRIDDHENPGKQVLETLLVHSHPKQFEFDRDQLRHELETNLFPNFEPNESNARRIITYIGHEIVITHKM